MMSGGCLCGATRYAIDGPFQVVGNCHCSICRRTSGAAFVTWGILAPDTFRWVAGEGAVQAYESSPGTARVFCGRCGSSLACTHGGVVGEVMMGTLDGDPGQRATDHIFVGSKAPWYEITDTLAQHDEWPPGFGP